MRKLQMKGGEKQVIVYLAGGFPWMDYPEHERRLFNVITRGGSGYHRLASFYHIGNCSGIQAVVHKEMRKEKKDEKQEEN
jgi:hypothetical protein